VGKRVKKRIKRSPNSSGMLHKLKSTLAFDLEANTYILTDKSLRVYDVTSSH
jgi:hypothetical protein